MRYLYIRHNASIMAMSIICPPEGPLDILRYSTGTLDIADNVDGSRRVRHFCRAYI